VPDKKPRLSVIAFLSRMFFRRRFP